VEFDTLRAMAKPRIMSSSHFAIKLPRLWLLTNRFLTIGQPLPRIVRLCADAGVKMTIMTETDLAPWVALELAEKLAETMHHHGGRLMVSERADLAQLAEADGVLITAAGFPALRLKTFLKNQALVGLLVRAEHELQRASADGIDFVLAAGVFSSEDLNSPPQNSEIERLRRIVEASAAPVVASGGMTPQRAPFALNAGASGVAMSEVAMESLDIRLLVAAFGQAMGGID